MSEGDIARRLRLLSERLPEPPPTVRVVYRNAFYDGFDPPAPEAAPGEVIIMFIAEHLCDRCRRVLVPAHGATCFECEGGIV